ncbi:elongation factor P [Patescibacteria group bacterium]|nr:elongation factor P [Patescibacteria group bacterium]
MLSMNDLKPGAMFVMEGEPYEVLDFKHIHIGRGGSTAQVKVKNIKTGSVLQKSVKPADRFEEVELERKKVKYLYNTKGQYWFCAENDPRDRFALSTEALGTTASYLKPNATVEVLLFSGEILNVNLPIKMEFLIKQAPPGIKGNTAQGGTKTAVLETGATVSVPLFVNEGDAIRINTQTGEYVERVNQK